MEKTIIKYSAEQVKFAVESNKYLQKVAKGFEGDGAFVKLGNGTNMLVPDIDGLPEFVDFVWAMVAFGHPGRDAREKVICKEIAKFLERKPYSMKKMAEVWSKK